MELDTTKLRQAGFRKTVTHDNCNVLDIGSGSYPRYIEVRPPGDDGSRMTAIWDGSLDLAVNDKVKCIEYGGNAIWAISAMGGADTAVGKIRVNKVFASDFSSESLVTDASDNITINTGTLTLPSEIIHLGDTDNKIGFTDDVQTYTVGGLELLKLTEAAQDLINLGPGSGDVDINFNGQMFLEGSSGRFGVNETTLTAQFHVTKASGTNDVMNIVGSAGTTLVDQFGDFYRDGLNATAGLRGTGVVGFRIDNTDNNDWRIESHRQAAAGSLEFNNLNLAGDARTKIVILGSGEVGISAVTPLAQLHVDQSSTTAAIPVVYFDQADISEEMIEFNTTIGTGNAIEAVGAKVLTTTHFIKVTLPGALTRYIPVGTIA